MLGAYRGIVMKNRYNRLSIFFITIISFSLVSDIPSSKSGVINNDYDQIMFEWSRTWAEVMHLVKQKHYKVADPKKSMCKAIDAFLNDIDPHSNFLDADTYTSMTQTINGKFDGIGVVIDNTRKTKDNFLIIVETIPDGPADKVGIKQYDKIVEIEDQSLQGMTTEQATSLLKGTRGTVVRIKVIREGQTDLLPFEITRDIIKDQLSLNFYIKNHNIYYLSLTMFTHNAAQQLKKLLLKAQQKPYKGLILDLRNNSGGLLNSAIDIASLFLDKGSLVVVTKDKDQKETERYLTTQEPIAVRATPIFILINNFTASAAEILAGCLALHAQANNQKQPLLVFLVGSPSFGKGSVQEVIPVSNNCAIKLTTALYFLPQDTPVQGLGITPDFIVQRCLPPTEQMTWFTDTYGRESCLDNHIKVVDSPTTKKGPVKKSKDKNPTERWQERVKQMLQTDNQLRETINLITMLATARVNIPALVKDRPLALTYLKQNHISHENLEIEEVKI